MYSEYKAYRIIGACKYIIRMILKMIAITL